VIARIDVRLPRFVRQLWVGPAARAHWEPRLAALRERVEALELAAAAATGGALLRDPARGEAAALRARAEARGLTTLRLPDRPEIAPQLADPTLVAAPAVAAAIAGAWHRGEREAVLAGLGLPPCCARAYVAAHVDAGWRDGAWTTLAGADATVSGPPALNRMLARVGLALLAHDPCTPDCPASLARAEAFMAFVAARDPEALAGLLAVLDWPLEWSALHGAVELRTPVVKLCWDTDATAEAVVRRREGGGWPEHAAVGQRFPYRPPERHRLVTSIGWRRGLAHADDGREP
jgi:hypothetical protein